jgi:DNA modification methylase
MPTATEKMHALVNAVIDKTRVRGCTHTFYKYPARFSPTFARTAIEAFSKEHDLVLDPYCGGGTTVVEAMRLKRRVVGNDLNSLATFVASVKTMPLCQADVNEIDDWLEVYLPAICYSDRMSALLDEPTIRNMNVPRARYLKKIIGLALHSLDALMKPRVVRFMRCAILQTAQWALDGRKSHTTVQEFKLRLAENIKAMSTASLELRDELQTSGYMLSNRRIYNGDASEIQSLPCFKNGRLVDLVVTSPPYPGVHMLYHRWQVDGRKETPAPYWIAGCSDGNGASFYNFGGRHQSSGNDYFSRSLQTLKAIRTVMKRGAHILQLIAFSNPDDHLPRYLNNMTLAGFSVVDLKPDGLIWRDVPSRKWHAAAQGRTASSKEVLLIHRAG